jgi:hypothetical protein
MPPDIALRALLMNAKKERTEKPMPCKPAFCGYFLAAAPFFRGLFHAFGFSGRYPRPPFIGA